MSTVPFDDTNSVVLFERRIDMPLGLHMEGGSPTPGRELPIWVDEYDQAGERVRTLCVDQVEVSLGTACELLAALAEAISVLEAQR